MQIAGKNRSKEVQTLDGSFRNQPGHRLVRIST